MVTDGRRPVGVDPVASAVARSMAATRRERRDPVGGVGDEWAATLVEEPRIIEPIFRR